MRQKSRWWDSQNWDTISRRWEFSRMGIFSWWWDSQRWERFLRDEILTNETSFSMMGMMRFSQRWEWVLRDETALTPFSFSRNSLSRMRFPEMGTLSQGWERCKRRTEASEIPTSEIAANDVPLACIFSGMSLFPTSEKSAVSDKMVVTFPGENPYNYAGGFDCFWFLWSCRPRRSNQPPEESRPCQKLTVFLVLRSKQQQQPTQQQPSAASGTCSGVGSGQAVQACSITLWLLLRGVTGHRQILPRCTVCWSVGGCLPVARAKPTPCCRASVQTVPPCPWSMESL